MEIDLTEEQKLLRDTCRDFAERELRPNAKRWDREHHYPAEAVKKAGLPVGVFPEIQVSLVVQPEETAELAPPSFSTTLYEAKLAAIERLVDEGKFPRKG